MQARRRLAITLLCVAALAACGSGRLPADPSWPIAAPDMRPPPRWGGFASESAGRQAVADLRNGDYAKVVAEEDAVIRRGRPQAQDYAVRANAEAAIERLPPAWRDFEQAIQLDPNVGKTYIDFGVWLDRAHQPARGARVLAAATRALPRSAGCYALLGWLQYQAGAYPQSIASSRRAEALDASLSFVRYNQALCFAALGDAARSAAAYRRALAFGSDETRQAALMEIRNALRRHPTSASLRQAEGLLCRRESHATVNRSFRPPFPSAFSPHPPRPPWPVGVAAERRRL
jgi:Tfp pilus assembly protein PilF